MKFPFFNLEFTFFQNEKFARLRADIV